MRDVTTSVAAFLILAVLATGIYLGVQKYHQAQAMPQSAALPDLNAVEDLINTLLGGGSTPAPPPTIGAALATPSGPASAPTQPAATRAAPRPTTGTAAPAAPPPTPAPLPTPTPVTTVAAGPHFPFTLRGPVRHDNACTGQSVQGTVVDAEGRPLAGVTVRLEDELGHRATEVSQSTPNKRGKYEFPVGTEPRRIYVWVVDEGGNAISPRVEILHLLPNSGYEAFPCHYVDWQKSE